jgi:hypothetical protein
MFILTALSALVSHVGIFALAGGPVGIAIAWLGSLVANKTVKIVSIAVGVLLVIGVTVGLTVRIEHLERDSAAYKQLSASNKALELRYGCTTLPAEARELAACLIFRDALAEKEKNYALKRLGDIAAKAQSDLLEANDKLAAQADSTNAFISQSAPTHDGRVPQVLLDTWARERQQRGVK